MILSVTPRAATEFDTPCKVGLVKQGSGPFLAFILEGEEEEVVVSVLDRGMGHPAPDGASYRQGSVLNGTSLRLLNRDETDTPPSVISIVRVGLSVCLFQRNFEN